MKKNKGFTLVEIIGVITIIAIILVFAVPAVVGILKKNDVNEYDRFIKDLCLSTETYAELNINSYPNLNNIGNSYQISMQILLDNSYVKSTAVNPKTDEKIKGTDIVKITKNSDGNFSCEYIAN